MPGKSHKKKAAWVDPSLIPLDPRPRGRPGRTTPNTLETAPAFSGPVTPIIPTAPPPRDTGEHGEAWLRDRQAELLAELAKRKCESLAIYQPLPSQDAFHKCKAQMRLARGSNRGGKTLVAAVELARACTNQDPYKKYPAQDGRAFLIGRDGKHLGDVMYRKLFRSAPFYIIRDLGTNRWRTYQPDNPDDVFRAREKRPAPPLIPPRFVESISWYDKKANIPNVIRLKNGWELSFFSSQAKPSRGSDIDYFWMDEEIEDPEWLPEMQARIIDRGGRGVASFTPQSGTEQFYELHERALEEASEPDPAVEEFFLGLMDNPFIAKRDKDAFVKSLSPEEREVRVSGEYAVLGYRIYPEWNQTHWVDWFEIPSDWTRYAFIDPGRQVCATLFLAVPPPGKDPHVYVYDELYLKECDARKWAKAFADKCRDRPLQAAWMDMHEARKFDTGSGRNVKEQYSRAMKRQGIKFVETGHDFHPAPDDVDGGIEAVRGWLTEDEGGITRLRVLRGKATNLDREMKHYHYKREGGVVVDKPVKKRDHLVDDLRYAALADPPWRKPRVSRRANSALTRALEAKRKRKRRRSGGSFVNLGPGS